MDRNDGNILVRRRSSAERVQGSSKYALIPIDHGLTLPDRLEIIEEDICWMSWPQAKQPFGAEALEYIASLNGERDTSTLQQALGIKRDPLRLMRCCTTLL